MIWIILPIAVITYFGRGYFARLIYKSLAPEIAIILGFLVGAIIFRTMYTLISRYFYSHKDTRTPLYVSLFTIGLNIYLAFTLAKPIYLGGYGIAGLAIAQSAVAAVEVVILMVLMYWRDVKLFDREFWRSLVRTLSVTGFTAVTAYIMVHIFPLEVTDRGFITLGTKIFLIIVPTIAVHVAVSSLFGLDEVRPVMAKMRQIMLRPVRIQ
jgi:putative peptidoglycan lipid II flippase